MARIRRAFALVLAALREIFDETAYERFLVREGVPSSREAYARFVQQEGRRQVRRPRCC